MQTFPQCVVPLRDPERLMDLRTVDKQMFLVSLSILKPMERVSVSIFVAMGFS